jgi:hypothetical protein
LEQQAIELRSKSGRLRSDSSAKGYKNGSGQGVECYSDLPNDLSNQEKYGDFLKLLCWVMKDCY